MFSFYVGVSASQKDDAQLLSIAAAEQQILVILVKLF